MAPFWHGISNRILVSLLSATFLSIVVLSAQQASIDGLRFEVTSIRLAAPLGMQGRPPNRGGPGGSDPERASYGAVSIPELLIDAYGIRELQLRFPAALISKRYDIVAKVPPGTSKEQFNKMVQNLLADRFHLQFHRQPTQFNMYKLVVGRGGPKLRETTFKSDDPLTPHHDQVRHDPDGVIVSTDLIIPQRRNGRVILSAGKLPISRLAKYLEVAVLHVPVTDATGQAGEYDIRLEFSSEGLRFGVQPPPLAASNSTGEASDPAPNIFQAFEQQLGLKLEKSKVILDVLVVDHVDEVPTEN
jgi:uncharacterized protein (TIGR03435 family)